MFDYLIVGAGFAVFFFLAERPAKTALEEKVLQ